MSRETLVILIICLSLPLTLAASLIELTDANQAILNLELSRGVKALQNAYKSDFKFRSVSEAVKFLFYCQIVEAKMKGTEDADYQGLAGSIKSLLAEQTIADACRTNSEQFQRRYSILDSYSLSKVDYLSRRKLSELIEFAKEAAAHPGLRLLLGNILNSKIERFAAALLKNGSHDTESMFYERLPATGWFDFVAHYKKGCQISLLNSICKIVRATRFDDVSASGGDIEDFMQILEANDEPRIEEHERKSRVQLAKLKQNCASLLRSVPFKVPRLIDGYLNAGFMSQEQLSHHLENDQNLHLYFSIYQMCMHL